MVGFGSSLRMARRSGWEGAYLDYETLKLLLSQIEAVYEEEGHRQRRSGNRVYLPDQDDQKKTRDYRDELFLESDSDKAYASVDDLEDMISSEEDLEQPKKNRQAKPFTLSYSLQPSSSEDEEDSPGEETGCAPSVKVTMPSWTTWDKKPSASDSTADKRSKARKRRSKDFSLADDEDAFYVKQSDSGEMNMFFVAGNEQNSEQTGPSILNAPVRLRTLVGEKTSLLPPATPAHPNSSLYTFQGNPSVTPPHLFAAPSADTAAGGGDRTRSPAESPPVAPSLAVTKSSLEERKRERKVRRQRRKRLKALRRERERKVPRHIRVAHSKARAITERFLGLLRAETEKVLLFAQSRLGELADTAGSLRFPSFEDNEYGSRAADELQRAGTYDYPLSDGGMHPSASSSEDEGVSGAHGTFPWSDSSDDEDQSREAQRMEGSMAKNSSEEGLSSSTLARSNRSPRMRTPQKQSGKNTREEIEVMYSESAKAVRRQIDHFAQLRNERPVFQRNDHILGEDMLLISAVEEADGYTAVAVELLHVLRYICINLIAVRKICRKHDRLLMNRMLGGYYHRTKTTEYDRYSHFEDAQTLGGLVARVSGDIYEAHPALIGHMTYFKLVGVYDRKIQKLANSRTVQVVSSCLALALSEYEVARTRADALTNLNSSATLSGTPKRSGSAPSSVRNAVDEGLLQPTLTEDEEVSQDPPSTSSTISLTRLRFAVTSIFALREAARFKLDHYGAYLSRTLVTFTGQPVIGEGLDGCSRETLDFLVSYNPDSVLLLDSSILFQGLKNGHWKKLPMSDIMVSTLAAATIPENLSTETTSPLLTQEEMIVAHAVSVVPGLKHIVLNSLLKGHLLKQVPEERSRSVTELPLSALRLSRISCFLFMMNYFVAHSTTVIFVTSSGAARGHSAVVIGAPNLSAVLVAILHCALLSKEYAAHKLPRYSARLIRRLLILSASMGVIGNIIHGVAVNRASVPLAILGRFIIGFSSLEIIHRQVIVTCLPSYVVSESAPLVRFRIFGIFCGLIAGSLVDAIPITIIQLGMKTIQSTSWLMTLLWLVHFLRLNLQLRPKDVDLFRGSAEQTNDKGGELATASVDYGSLGSSSDSDEPRTPTSVLYRSSSDITSHDPFKDAYGSTLNEVQTADSHEDEMEPLMPNQSQDPVKKRTFRQVVRIRKLLSYHVGIPIALMGVVYAAYALEVLFTSAPIVGSRYFGWSGAHVGVLLACLAVLNFPINFICELIARRYEERTVIRRSLIVIGCGLFAMINWVSLFSLAAQAPELLTDTYGGTTHPYDWKLGRIQYVVGLTITFIGLVSLEGAALSLLSKVSPPRLRSVVLNSGTIVVFLGLIVRMLGDLQIFMIELSHKLIYTCVVNSLVIPLLLACFFVGYFVKKHFFFLM